MSILPSIMFALSRSAFSACCKLGCLYAECKTAINEERASCVEMEKDMGLGRTHDHAEMKGQGQNPMNLNHDRCAAILAESK